MSNKFFNEFPILKILGRPSTEDRKKIPIQISKCKSPIQIIKIYKKIVATKPKYDQKINKNFVKDILGQEFCKYSKSINIIDNLIKEYFSNILVYVFESRIEPTRETIDELYKYKRYLGRLNKCEDYIKEEKEKIYNWNRNYVLMLANKKVKKYEIENANYDKHLFNATATIGGKPVARFRNPKELAGKLNINMRKLEHAGFRLGKFYKKDSKNNKICYYYAKFHFKIDRDKKTKYIKIIADSSGNKIRYHGYPIELTFPIDELNLKAINSSEVIKCTN